MELNQAKCEESNFDGKPSNDEEDLLAQQCLQAALEILTRQQPALRAEYPAFHSALDWADKRGNPELEIGASLTPERLSNNSEDELGVVAVGNPDTPLIVNESVSATDVFQTGQSALSADPIQYKVFLCREFATHATCGFGSRCACAHGAQELRTVGQNLSAIHSIYVLSQLPIGVKQGPKRGPDGMKSSKGVCTPWNTFEQKPKKGFGARGEIPRKFAPFYH